MSQVYFYPNETAPVEPNQVAKSNSAEAQLGVARAQIAEGSFADAVQALEPLSKSQPDNAEVVELLAQAYRGMGKTEEAERVESRAKNLKRR